MQILPLIFTPITNGFPKSLSNLWGSTPTDVDVPLDEADKLFVLEVEDVGFTPINETLFTPDSLITPMSSEELTTTGVPLSFDNSTDDQFYEPEPLTSNLENNGPESITETPIVTSRQERKNQYSMNQEPPPMPTPSRQESSSTTQTTTVQKAPANAPAPMQSAIEIVAKRHLQITQPQCGAEIGSFWQYGDLPLDWIDVETAAECCELCDDKKECYKWSFGLAGKFSKRCYLKQASAYSQAREQFISGYATLRGTRPEDGEL